MLRTFHKTLRLRSSSILVCRLEKYLVDEHPTCISSKSHHKDLNFLPTLLSQNMFTFRTFADMPPSRSEKKAEFEEACEETLESLTEYFEELVENSSHLSSADVNYSDGVLTVNFGDPYGTYVINRQTPNSQIWLSSPTSGPKRYDFLDGVWIYRHDGKTLHALLDEEIPKIVKSNISFLDQCKYSK